MNNFLLNASEFFSKISDFFSAQWPKVLAVLSSSVVIGFICKFIFNLIMLQIEKKSKLKMQKPELERYDNLINCQKQQTETIKLLMQESKKELIESVKNIFIEEQNEKERIYTAITNEQPLKFEKIEEVKQEEITLKQEEQPVVEQTIETNQNEVSSNENSSKSEYKKAKRVIEGE